MISVRLLSRVVPAGALFAAAMLVTGASVAPTPAAAACVGEDCFSNCRCGSDCFWTLPTGSPEQAACFYQCNELYPCTTMQCVY